MMHPDFNLLGMHHAGKIVSPIPLVPLPSGKGEINSENECEAAPKRRFTFIFGSILDRADSHVLTKRHHRLQNFRCPSFGIDA